MDLKESAGVTESTDLNETVALILSDCTAAFSFRSIDSVTDAVFLDPLILWQSMSLILLQL